MHHRSTKTRPTKPCLRRMVDPHLLASGVCEKERKSELNSRAAGKGVWHPSEGASRGAAAASKRARAARRRACGVGEVKLCLLARASRTTPTSARTMPPSHLTAKRHRRRTRRRRAVASQTTSAMRPPRRRGGRRVPAAGPSSVAGPARPSWPARLPTREDRRERAKCGQNGMFANPSRRLHGGTSRIDVSPPAPACAPRNSIQNRYLVRPLNRSWRGATAILHLCATTLNNVQRR